MICATLNAAQLESWKRQFTGLSRWVGLAATPTGSLFLNDFVLMSTVNST